ncbi:MAG: cytochrome c [Candidatus Thiodiazotropha sp.]
MIRILIPAMVLTLASTTSLAADPAAGKQLYKEHCVKCHDSEVYTRKNRRISSLQALHKQVRFCEQNLGLTWFDDQIEDTAAYLNQEYYNFDSKP